MSAKAIVESRRWCTRSSRSGDALPDMDANLAIEAVSVRIGHISAVGVVTVNTLIAAHDTGPRTVIFDVLACASARHRETRLRPACVESFSNLTSPGERVDTP